jgi:hypothetical protein
MGGLIVTPASEDATRLVASGSEVVVVHAGDAPRDPSVIAARTSVEGERTAASLGRDRYLGLGDSNLNPFIAAREASQDADVVFLSSAHYKNLSVLAYALRDDRKPVIAVLRSRSTNADKIGAMVKVMEAKAYSERYVEADTPEELVKLTAAAVRKRAEELAKAAAEKGKKPGVVAKKVD